MSHGRHFSALAHHSNVINGKQSSLPGYCLLSYLHFDHISPYLALVWDTVSTECSFPPVFCCFVINMNLKDTLCVYVNKAAEARNPQNKISVTTNDWRHRAGSHVKKSEAEFYCKAMSSVVPSNIVTLPCCLPNDLSGSKTASQHLRVSLCSRQ